MQHPWQALVCFFALIACSSGEGGAKPNASPTGGAPQHSAGATNSGGSNTDAAGAGQASSVGGGPPSPSGGTAGAHSPNEPAAAGGDASSGSGPLGDSRCEGEASYSIVVDVTWADESVSGKHYTTLIGAVHAASFDVWHPGGLATPGVQQMAESGGTQTLSQEVQAAIDQGNALSIVKLSGGNPPASSAGEILVTGDFSWLSLGSMMAPTPDLFIGLSSLNLCEDGEFVASKTLDAVVYDAGTKNGDDFSYGSGATSPHAPIALGKQFSAPQGTITVQKL